MCYGEKRSLAEIILLPFGEVVSAGFGVVVFDFRRQCSDVTHPQPLSRGEVGCFVLLGNEWFVVWRISPLERGLRGVLR